MVSARLTRRGSEARGDIRRQAPRSAGEVHAGGLDIGAGEQSPFPGDFLGEGHARAPHLDKQGFDLKEIIDTRRREPFSRHLADGECKRLIPAEERRMRDAAGAKGFRTSAFEEMQIARMVDDPGKIGVLVIDPDRNLEFSRSHG